MAITETRNLPPEYLEALGKTYASDLTRQAGIPSITTANAQQAGETADQFAQRQTEIPTVRQYHRETLRDCRFLCSSL